MVDYDHMTNGTMTTNNIDALLPRMGSDAWWEKEVEQGTKSLKARKGTVITSKEELKKFLQTTDFP